ncbi:hypothetical protein DFH08DRAFT_973579 [Mycena albidolilacea]|uniref:Uncharacterized protein n=1 Tax=Mycena albidolilacea TaxID=1033008 RepID=A0AAD7EDI3_9AGAR|nr:hypothetical protein DFH08DRAFT_973579 [Mycena albidolilacea]
MSTARRVEREATQEPGAEFDDALGELGIQPPRITAAQKGKGAAMESSPVPAPELEDGMNLEEEDVLQQDKVQQITVIDGDDSDDPVEANGAEQVHMESSPAKEAASQKVKNVANSEHVETPKCIDTRPYRPGSEALEEDAGPDNYSNGSREQHGGGSWLSGKSTTGTEAPWRVDLQSSIRSVSGELQTNLDAPPTPFQHQLVSPDAGGEPMTLSLLLAMFEDDYNIEMGVYVVSQEKLKAFIENRAGSVATSQAAHAIANLTASGGSSAEVRTQEEQGPQYEGEPIFLTAAATRAHGLDERAEAGHVQSYRQYPVQGTPHTKTTQSCVG